MKNPIYNFEGIAPELNLVQKSLSGRLSKEQDVFILTLDSETGVGQVRFTTLQPGITIFDFNIQLQRDTVIRTDSFISDTLQFLFPLEGNCSHQFIGSGAISVLEELQTGVIHSTKNRLSNIVVRQNEHLILNVISVNKKQCFENLKDESNDFYKKFQKLLDHIDTEPNHFHLGGHNLKIAEQLKLLNGIEYDNEISKFLSQKGRYYMVLAKQIDQFYIEIQNPNNTSSLLKKELKKISELSEYIKEKPEIQHSINSLCAESGLSPAKLQDGFKFLYNRTVSDFIRNVRLEKSERLIRTTDLNISEIVYTIGLTSRSYFCKIFRNKYQFSPRNYRTKKPAKIEASKS